MLLAVLAPVSGVIEADRERLNLKPRTAGEALGPEEAVGTVLIGPARGFINLQYWMRAMTLQEEHETAELLDLYRRITKLQPRNEKVWVQLADKLILDLSEEEPTHEQRWAWVEEGLNLLDEGLNNVPQSPALWESIGTTYRFKGGQYMIDILRRELGRPLLDTLARWRDLAHALLAIIDGADLAAFSSPQTASIAQTQDAASSADAGSTRSPMPADPQRDRLRAALLTSEIAPYIDAPPLSFREREELTRCIEAVGMNVLYAPSLQVFREYRALSARQKAIYRELNRFRYRLEALFYREQFREHGADAKLLLYSMSRCRQLAFPVAAVPERQAVLELAAEMLSLWPGDRTPSDVELIRLRGAAATYEELRQRARAFAIMMPAAADLLDIDFTPDAAE